MSASPLSLLEAAVLQAMVSQYPDSSAAFRKQLDSATVVLRENTGAGFYAHLRVDQSIDLLKHSVYRGVSASVKDLKNPVLFVLFVENGFIDLLEAAAVDEVTSNIDFCEADFKINIES